MRPGGGIHKPFVPPARVPLHPVNAGATEQADGTVGAILPPCPQPAPPRPGAFRPPSTLVTPTGLGIAVAPVGSSYEYGDGGSGDALVGCPQPLPRAVPQSSAFTASRPAYGSVPRAVLPVASAAAAASRPVGGGVGETCSAVSYYRVAYAAKSAKKRKNKTFMVRALRCDTPVRVRRPRGKSELCS